MGAATTTRPTGALPFRQHLWDIRGQFYSVCRRCPLSRAYIGVRGRRSLWRWENLSGVVGDSTKNVPHGCLENAS